MNQWIKEIVAFCDEYNIPYRYLPDTLREPKVVPMVRGKAFEFNVMIVLRKILNPKEWKVEKVKMNAQLGFHDEDVCVKRIKTGKRIAVECKLAKKEGFKKSKDAVEIRVKCMRSRTLGPSKVKALAPKFKIPARVLAIHNDQYTTKDFDVVVTSIGNAFYRTDTKTGIFKWDPKSEEIEFLRKLFCTPNASIETLKKLSFEKLYVARSQDIAIRKENLIVCTRKKCKNQANCGFIPNYPVIHFSKEGESIKPWYSLSKAEEFFASFS